VTSEACYRADEIHERLYANDVSDVASDDAFGAARLSWSTSCDFC
jgi:hypothetical protein